MAASILVGYDLNRPHQDYGDLIDAIKALGTWWHCLDSTWIVKELVLRSGTRSTEGAYRFKRRTACRDTQR